MRNKEKKMSNTQFIKNYLSDNNIPLPLYIIVLFVLLLGGCQKDVHELDDSLHINRSVSYAKKNFTDPPIQYKSRPLWFWNTQLSNAQTLKVMVEAKEKGYYGLGILPSHGISPKYMSPGFLEHYKFALKVADSLKMKMSFYDEFYFPSGIAGGNLLKYYPEAVSKRLDKEEYKFTGPGIFRQEISNGDFMGAVAMELKSLERIDISEYLNERILNTSLPAGDWNIMIFLLNPDQSSGRNHVDYLDSTAVKKFIELTYDKFYEAFPEHFGTTIDHAFYDEPCMRWTEGARTWTGEYNKKFMEHYGFSPIEYYPSLWYDIGPETHAARNFLFGFRAELFASGFAGTINKWCTRHHIQLTGHVDEEELLNPVSICGDLMKTFKYQDIPGVDQIAHYGRASKIYKVVSSSAINYDRPLVTTESYGAIRNMQLENLFKEAMEQFAKGINLMVPHGVWYSDKIDIPPDLSPQSTVFGPHLADYNSFIGRLQLMLQGGQHIADIAVLYPITSLQANYYFENPGDQSSGGNVPWEADYLDLGEILSNNSRTDYTFVHPETLDEKCVVENATLAFHNSTELSNYQVVIIPGSKTIKWSNLQKIKNFFDNGGTVIATSVLPEFSAELGMDDHVKSTIKEMFGVGALGATEMARVSASSIWNTGGFLPAYAIDGGTDKSWRPSNGNPEGEWIEIDFGRTIKTDHIGIAGQESLEYTFWRGWSVVEEDQTFSFRLHAKTGDNWSDLGIWEYKGYDTDIHFSPLEISAIRLTIETGKREKVSISEINIFNQKGENIEIISSPYLLNHNEKGGEAYFIPVITGDILREVMNETLKVWDVRTPDYENLADGNFTYIHKRMDGKDIYYFANSSDDELEIPVKLKGKMKITKWDPHSGTIEKYPTSLIRNNDSDMTQLQFKLGPVESVFFVSD